METLDELVRDLTAVSYFKAKSEVRQRITELMEQKRSNLISEIKREVEGMKEHLVIAEDDEMDSYDDAKQGGHDKALDQVIKYLNEKEGGKNDQ